MDLKPHGDLQGKCVSASHIAHIGDHNRPVGAGQSPERIINRNLERW